MNDKTACKEWMKISHDIRNTGKHDFHRFAIFIFILSFFMKKHNSITGLYNYVLHINRFLSDLVHRHIYYNFFPLYIPTYNTMCMELGFLPRSFTELLKYTV